MVVPFSQKLTPFGLLYYNALVALPVSIALAFVYMEFDALSTYEYRLNVVSAHSVVCK